MNNKMNYKRMFNNIWNTQVLTFVYEIKAFYKNGLMLKYYPFVEVKDIINNQSIEKGVKK